MIAQFDEFAAASAYARQLSASTKQVVSVSPTQFLWVVQPSGEGPTEWMNLISDEVEPLEGHSIVDFFEYQAANDASFIRSPKSFVERINSA